VVVNSQKGLQQLMDNLNKIIANILPRLQSRKGQDEISLEDQHQISYKTLSLIFFHVLKINNT